MTKAVAKKTVSKAPRAKLTPKPSTEVSRKAKREAAVKAAPDTITVTKNVGNNVFVESAAGQNFIRPHSGDTKEFRAIAKNGMSFAKALAFHSANPAPKREARLANGVGGRDAPHSAKALRDQKAEQTEQPKGKVAKAAAPKAAKEKQPSRGADRDYAKGATAINAKPDSWRHHMLTVMQKNTNTAKAKAAHEKSGKFSGNKLDFNWAAAQGYIVWSK